MSRKKWTPNETITDSLLKFREKRKWQLAFRRYIIEGNLSEAYAPFFGLDSNSYRTWIEQQFSEELSWKNFGSSWQFDHILPLGYFDFGNSLDLRLCWSFINVRVGRIKEGQGTTVQGDLLAAKPYFNHLFKKTGFALCLKMVEKIEQIELTNRISTPNLEEFLLKNKEHLEKLSTLSSNEFARLNRGESLSNIFLEREILKKFG